MALQPLAGLVLLLAVHVSSSGESCGVLYERGVRAYLENDFDGCAGHLEQAIEAYRRHASGTANCRRKCAKEALAAERLVAYDVEDLGFFERAVRRTLCAVQCKSGAEEDGYSGVTSETEQLFEKRKPYEYLHICYYQTDRAQKAASAVFTYLAEHPKDDTMLANLKFYSGLDGVRMDEVINFEAKDYVYFYLHGTSAYDKKDWDSVIRFMEESLESYFDAEEDCRALCEGPFDQGWYPDLIPSIANHFTFSTRCKQKCRKRLGNLNGEYYDDFLPSHYHYLQYAYFKTGNLEAACECVATYLLFYPHDETMWQNKEFYSTLPKFRDTFFEPREDVITYKKRQDYEDRLLQFVDKNFIPEKITIKQPKKELNPEYLMGETELKGRNRFAYDGLATKRECQMMVHVARTFGKRGDGYYDSQSPHTSLEVFRGITLDRITLLVYLGLLDPKYLSTYLKVTERVKNRIENFFSIRLPLYFSYTHLVCRTATSGSHENRTDFSHAIHADNCNIFENGVCTREAPAYTWRDYSAILYLNDDFSGGEFVFSTDMHGRKIQSVVMPTCGRMVGFSAGGENLHGVKAVKRGSRCALGIWLTFDAEHMEKDRDLSYKLI